MMLQKGGNEIVNAKYLAKYNAGEMRGRMRMPSNNSDLNALRTWIQYKYVDKIWFADDGSGSMSAPVGRVPEAPAEVQTAPPGRRKIINAQPQPQEDLFGGGGWDAFGNSPAPAPAADNFADFGANTAPDNSFQADFGSQQPTMVNMPPQQQFGDFGQQNLQQQPQQQPFEADFDQPQFQANFDQPQQQNGYNAKFDQCHVNGQQSQQVVPSFQANIEQPNQGMNNFGNMQQHGINQQQHFGNFDKAQTNANQNNPQHIVQQQQQQQQGMFNANFDASPNMQAHQQSNMFQANFEQSNNNAVMNQGMGPNNMQSHNQGMNNFGNFDQPNMNQSSVQQPVMGMMNQDNNFGNFDQASTGGFGDISQRQQVNTPQININTMQGSGMVNSTNESIPGLANQKTNPNDAHSQPENQPALNPNAFRSVDDGKKSAFDAFDGLSLEPSPGLMEKSWADDAATASSAPPPPVFGDSNVDGGYATVTDDTAKSVKVQEIVMMLQNLSVEQLSQVENYISSLGSSVARTTTQNNNLLADSAAEMKSMVLGVQHQHMGVNDCAANYNGQSMQQSQYTPNPGFTPAQAVGVSSTVPGNMNGSMPNGGMTYNQQQVDMGPHISSNMNGTPDFNSKMGMPPGDSMSTNDQSMQNDDVPKVPTSSSLFPRSTLPPVEKEGNPFDIY
jgi:hypothetical protein